MKVLAFGEILFDVFGENKKIGGAAFNFSSHLSKLGASVSLVSAVGNDELGKKAISVLKENQVLDDLIGISHFPTGKCQVSIDQQGVPTYHLLRDVSYDNISLRSEQWDAIINKQYNAFYFGTLAQRSEKSRQTLDSILDRCCFEHILFDINIRQCWYSDAVLKRGLNSCTILKVSREECKVFEETGLVNTVINDFQVESNYHRALCRELARVYSIDIILFTLDKDGALVYDVKQDEFYCSEKPHSLVVSTVGAGDSFSACFLYYFLLGEPVKACLNKAIILSDYVVRYMEAIPEYSQELCKLLNI